LSGGMRLGGCSECGRRETLPALKEESLHRRNTTREEDYSHEGRSGTPVQRRKGDGKTFLTAQEKRSPPLKKKRRKGGAKTRATGKPHHHWGRCRPGEPRKRRETRHLDHEGGVGLVYQGSNGGRLVLFSTNGIMRAYRGGMGRGFGGDQPVVGSKKEGRKRMQAEKGETLQKVKPSQLRLRGGKLVGYSERGSQCRGKGFDSQGKHGPLNETGRVFRRVRTGRRTYRGSGEHYCRP